MRKIVLLYLLLAAATFSQGQGGFAFGVKGGPTIGLQQWEGFEQDPLFKYHGIAFIESLTEENAFAVCAQLGYHLKGSAFRGRLIETYNGQPFRPAAQEFIFKNLSLMAGAKQKFPLGGANANNKVYYLLGVRLDYTLGTNLDKYLPLIEANPTWASFPIDDKQLIREINYGISLGGGVEIPFSELVGVLLEFTVNPDFSYQYEQPELRNVTDPYTGNSRDLPERRIRNLTFELTAGFRFLRKVEYID